MGGLEEKEADEKLLRTFRALKSASGCLCVKMQFIGDRAAAVRALFIYNYKYAFISAHIYCVLMYFQDEVISGIQLNL